jgi:hypothetical protein
MQLAGAADDAQECSETYAYVDVYGLLDGQEQLANT